MKLEEWLKLAEGCGFEKTDNIYESKEVYIQTQEKTLIEDIKKLKKCRMLMILSSLETIEDYPPLLEGLYLSNNPLKNIAPFPPTLKTLYLRNCGLKVLPPVPSHLEELDISNNPNLKINIKLPNSLKRIKMNHDLAIHPEDPNKELYDKLQISYRVVENSFCEDL